MDIINVVGQVRELLRQQGRLSYRIVRRQFALDEAALEDVKFELIEVQAVAVDQDSTMLVWTGPPSEQPTGSPQHPEAIVFQLGSYSLSDHTAKFNPVDI